MQVGWKAGRHEDSKAGRIVGRQDGRDECWEAGRQGGMLGGREARTQERKCER